MGKSLTEPDRQTLDKYFSKWDKGHLVEQIMIMVESRDEEKPGSAQYWVDLARQGIIEIGGIVTS